MKTALIVGLGIGSLYYKIYEELGWNIVTVDLNGEGNYLELSELPKDINFNTAHICTPNFTHESLTQELLDKHQVDVLFVEKPGVEDSRRWEKLVQQYRSSRIMMVKNNMWRKDLKEYIDIAAKAEFVVLSWENRMRIPHPGSWFTTKKLAYGGVSRDLMPHLLSMYILLNPNWETDKLEVRFSAQNHLLENITETEYGDIYSNGVYDVDDECRFVFSNKWTLQAHWANERLDNRCIDFLNWDGDNIHYNLGLCPEEAYKEMIVDATSQLANDEFWIRQHKIDKWIHNKLGLL